MGAFIRTAIFSVSFKSRRTGSDSDARGTGLTEALGEVVRSGFGGDGCFFEGAFFAFFDKQCFVVGRVEGKINGLVQPGGEQDGVGEFNAVDALAGGGEQKFSLENGVGEVLKNFDVLAAALVDGDVHVPGFGHGEGGLGFHAKLAHRLTVALEVDACPVDDGESALLGGDFEAVGARCFTGGGDKGGRGAVFVLENGGDIVFDFDFVETSELAEATNAVRHAEEPLEQIKVVRALVHEDAAALPFPGAAPAAGGVVIISAEPVGDLPVNAADGAEFTGINEVLDLLEDGVGALVEHGREDFALVGVGGDEAFAVGLVNGDGFFNQHMKSGLEGGDADGGVGEVGGADEDGIDFAAQDHFMDIGEGGFAFLGGGDGANAFAKGGDAEAGHFARADVCKVCLAHVAESYDAKSYIVHAGESREGVRREK